MRLVSWLMTAAGVANVVVAVERTKYNFNAGWRLLVGDDENAINPTFDDSDWDNVTLPHAWNEDDAFAVDIASLSTGIAWYRKSFSLPTVDGKVFLEFEGIRFAGEFYLNGKWIGRSEDGIMAFGFDVTDFVVTDTMNVVAARIDNSWTYHELATNSAFQWNDKNFYANYGGINKNAYLHVTGSLYQTLPLYSNLNSTGVYVYATNIDVPGESATITSESEVKNEGGDAASFSYSFVLKDMDQTVVATINGPVVNLASGQNTMVTASGKVDGLKFWSWGYGYLYTAETSLYVDGKVVDIISTITGFRKTAFKDGYVTLNDRAIQVHGYAQRSTNEWPALGCAVPSWLSDFSNSYILGSNGNLIRWMHVTPAKQDVESLDRLGIMQALPAGDSEGDVTGDRWNQRVRVMRDAIIYHKNSPSILFYESGNSKISEDHMQEMKDLRDLYDPRGGRAAGAREMLNSTVAEYGGEMLYINKGSTIPFWAHEYSRDEGQRTWWDNFTSPYHPDGAGTGEGAVYNRNQDSHAVEDIVRWFDYYEQRPGTGKRVSAGGANIIFSDSNTHHRGSLNYRTSGEVDAMRLPKDAWWAHKVMWDSWVDVEKAGIHILGHWNYNASTVKDIYVVSTTDEVELYLNGQELGEPTKRSQFFFTFEKVKWESGELEARGYMAGNPGVAASDVRRTTGASSSIRLRSYTGPNGFVASGGDVALIEVEIVDGDGNRVPTATDTINFELTGPAVWRGGVGPGRDDNFVLSPNLPVVNGVNRVLIRSTTSPGQVTLTASSGSLRSTSITLKTAEFEVVGGLSTSMPSDGLIGNLSRGPTPTAASFKPSRKSINIVRATAGSNQNTAGQSFDSDEYTSWSSGTSVDSAWIRYELSQQTTVDSVVVKVGSQRTASYRFSILVDGKSVWDDITSPNLGYVTLRFTPTQGSNLTIQSTSGRIVLTEVEVYGPL